jgi:hypothetical protein
MIRFLSVYHPATILKQQFNFICMLWPGLTAKKKARVAGFIITLVIQIRSTTGHRG